MVLLLSEGNVATDDRNGLWADIEKRGDGIQGEMLHDAGTTAEQQFVAFARRRAVEVKIAGAGLTQQVFADDTSKLHRIHVLTEQLHQLFVTDSMYAAGHHRLNRGQRRAMIETGRIVAHELARKREPRDMRQSVADPICRVLEAPFCDKAEPPCRFALAFHQLSLLVIHALAFPLTEVSQLLQVNTVHPEFLFHIPFVSYLMTIVHYRT